MSAFLVIQTAFAGDLILALPIAQELRRLAPGSRIDLLCIPETIALLRGHPAIDEAIAYDKRGGSDSLFAIARRLRARRYDGVISPHRSLRSALLAFATGAPTRISFDRSTGAALYTHRVRYRGDEHEVTRNLDLLAPLFDDVNPQHGPRLYPSESDRKAARAILERFETDRPHLCVAPGSVWATKRYTVNGYRHVVTALSDEYNVLLTGGKDDREICEQIAGAVPAGRVVSAAGVLSYLASAAAIESARVLISNDSAPVHIASAMGTPVAEIFGATIPAFGFTPFGVPHRIVQREGLACRPCNIHGGHSCPIKTFACMEELEPGVVLDAVIGLLGERR